VRPSEKNLINNQEGNKKIGDGTGHTDDAGLKLERHTLEGGSKERENSLI